MSKVSKPTESELQILRVLWQTGKTNVRAVNEVLNESQEKEIGYTTTLKIMQIMHEKGLLSREKDGRTHLYEPAVAQETIQKTLTDRLLDSVFGGSAMKLVMQALGNKKTSKEELEQIKKLIQDIENDENNSQDNQKGGQK